jgi:hypothetical protein
MEFRWLVALTIYTLLIGPIMDIPSSNAKAKGRTTPHAQGHTSQAVANR